MSERDIQSAIMLAHGRGDVRLFRNNSAQAWGGEVIARTPTTITLRNPKPIHVGLCKGSSDLIGWKSFQIEPAHVGATVAAFVAIECKSETGRVSDDQKLFVSAVMNAGGLAGIARSVDDAALILTPQTARKYDGN